MKENIYIVNAYRFGSRENHSYTVGVTKKKAQAIKWADSHWVYRGGKYDCTVEVAVCNEFDNDADSYTKQIYSTNNADI